jgi:hypothetical protein
LAATIGGVELQEPGVSKAFPIMLYSTIALSILAEVAINIHVKAVLQVGLHAST